MARQDTTFDAPSHTPGTKRGEQMARIKGREPGRDDPMKAFRTGRDSTSVNPEDMEPIDPRMPYLPPP
jgi:hypothetical protein